MFGPPGGDAQYPAVAVPTNLGSGHNAPASATPAASAPAATTPGSASSEDSTAAPVSRVRLVRPGTDAGAPPGPPEHGYLPDPAPLSERARWLYEIRYDRGVVQAGTPELECLDHPEPSARRIGRFAFELWIGAALLERIRFDFPLLAAEVPRSGTRRPLHEDPSFAPGARVSIRLQVPASSRATRAQILDRATGQVTPVDWPPREGTSAQLCAKGPSAPTPSAH
ncbi:MAG TPA: hypothetical protein VFS67_29970 [Polyangiaceae bacterium]|nr:hypothetical protein [Polyangiaceae bacterium]